MSQTQAPSSHNKASALSVAQAKVQIPAAVEVPERPALALNVQLIGQMSGTAYEQQQWLIQRGGRFIQVTELLYRLAQQINGERTLEEIAERLTESTDWIVDSDNVRQLIRTKLIPLRLVATPGDPIESHGESDKEDTKRSALAVNMRVKVLSPRVVDLITKPLQALHSPFIITPVLVAAAIAHWWLYRVHGLSDGISDALNTPGGLLIVLAVVILSAFFHEFGHASALRYGGGKVRAMGVGLYVIYPALYTDVTDSYRLSRWARLRTDLGGIYFHLIFALGLIALSAASGKDLFLLAVVLINLEMIWQFIPFLRLDGYWVLADLTGIPDFFSLMGPFLRSMIPGAKGGKLPSFKPWVRWVFVIYTVATMPLLAYVFFLMVRGLPSFLRRMWSVLVIQADMISTAQSQGEFYIVALWGLSMLCIVLPVLGTLYILYSVISRSARGIWTWGRPTPLRRLAAALGTAVIVVVVALAWMPQLRNPAKVGIIPVQGDGQTSPPAANTAEILLSKTRDATASLNVLQADIEGHAGSDQFSGTVLLKRPNLARITINGSKGDVGEFSVVSDGMHRYTFFPAENAVAQMKAAADGRNISAYLVEQVEHFFRPATIGAIKAGGSLVYAGKERVDNIECDVIIMEAPPPKGGITRYFISPEDQIIRRVVTAKKSDKGEPVVTSWASLKNIRVNVPVDEAIFRWTPPRNVKPLQMPEGVNVPGCQKCKDKVPAG